MEEAKQIVQSMAYATPFCPVIILPPSIRNTSRNHDATDPEPVSRRIMRRCRALFRQKSYQQYHLLSEDEKVWLRQNEDVSPRRTSLGR